MADQENRPSSELGFVAAKRRAHQGDCGHAAELRDRRRVKEMINVVELVEDSMRMNEGALSRHGVEVIREFEKVPPMNVEKHKILQILVNLMRNAKYACEDSGARTNG
jgi:C4-dicarboxylate-specific signal transduction histidine kinase